MRNRNSFLILLPSPPGKLLYQDTRLPPPPRQKNFQNSYLLRHSNILNVYLFHNSELKLGKSKGSNSWDKKSAVQEIFWDLFSFCDQEKKQNKKTKKETDFTWNFPKPPILLLNFLLNMYISPWLEKIFKFMISDYWKMYLQTIKIESRHFFSCP